MNLLDHDLPASDLSKVAAADVGTANVPHRTCIGCRKVSSQLFLLRFVRQDMGSLARVLPDTQRRLGGRGAWLHQEFKCYKNATDRNAFNRALRVKAQLDLSLVTAMFELPAQT